MNLSHVCSRYRWTLLFRRPGDKTARQRLNIAPLSAWKTGVCLVFVLAFTTREIFSQCPAASFTAPPAVCRNENFFLQNNSTGAARVEWDFCPLDLVQTPSVTALGALTTLTSIEDIKVVKDNGQWYAFALGRQSNTIARIEFGANPANAGPFIVPIGNPGNLMNAPTAIEIVKEGAKWLGVVLNSGNSKLVLLDFGTSLSNNNPTASEIYSSIGSSNSSMTIIQPGAGTGVALVCDFNSNTVKAVRFDQGFTQAASGVTSVAIAGNSNPIDLHAVEQCGNWYVYVIGYSGRQITRLDYLQDFISVPAQTSFGSGSFPANPYRIWTGREGNTYRAFVSSEDGTLLRVDLGTDPLNTSPPVTVLGKLGVLANTWSLDFAHENGRWLAFTVNGASGSKQSYQISFPEICSSSISYSTASAPGVLSYSAQGSQPIALTAFDSNEHSASSSVSVNVSSSLAPAITIGVDAGRCLTHTNAFQGISADPINSFAWDFGDANTSAIQNPTHQYGSAGQFDIQLTVAGANGCNNITQQNLVIFNEPVADFTLPQISQFCTNQNYSFTNTTQADAGSNPSWVWLVDGVMQSTNQDFSTLFNNTVPKVIKLQASIPGCTNEKTTTINSISQGPLTDFTFNNACIGTTVAFSNQTTGQVTSYTWDFGDGNTSSQTDAQHAFAATGQHAVVLIANNAAGCQNSATKTVTIYSLPQPDFSLDLPPFSCSGTPSQFNDTTPNPTDSNILTWAWTFGDDANGTSTQRNPLFTYASAGPYFVGLTVTTNFGCSASISKAIAIAQSPTASFSHTPACVAEGTQFTDTSTGAIKSWLWNINSSTYTFNNPLQVFGIPGTYTAQLTVTDNNNCIAQTTRTIDVPFEQVPDFSTQSTCATKPAIFQDTTPLSSDPITSVSWDFAGQGAGSGSPAQFIFPATGNYSVRMDARATSGCVYSVTKTIAVVNPPIAGFTAEPDGGPVPLHVQFTNTSTNAIAYQWHFHDKTDSTTSIPSPSFTFYELGEYIVDLDAANVQGCLDTFSKVISAVIPRVDAGLSGLQLVRDPSSGEYQALFIIDNAGNLPLTNPAILAEISGSVTLKETVNLTVLPGQHKSQILNYSLLPGNLDYICLSVDVAQDVSSYNNKQCVSLKDETITFAPYPNPVNGELHFDWIAVAPGVAQLTIYNSNGATAFDRSVEAQATGLNQIRLDVSNLSPGMYLMVFNYSGQKKTFRFAIH